MLTVYPSNKLEHHVDVLLALLNSVRVSPLQSMTILVENKAMQHWLQMEIAKRAGIAMQFEFKMPSAFIWQTARRVMDNVPTDTTYSRDVLRWRIDEILDSDTFNQHPLVIEAELRGYWQRNNRIAAMMRFQLASELADLFEQYLMFRPQELHDWSQGHSPHWQAYLWKTLVEQDAQHPLAVQQRLLSKLTQADLPEHLMMFAINHMPPQTLELFKTLSTNINIHLFHLNPCFEFWGDVVTDKMRSRRQSDEVDGEQISNPLLANLGQQGKDFFNRLLEGGHNEISLQADHIPPEAEPSLLQQIQQDILELVDARQMPQSKIDNSIHLVSCHSALREVQTLHDWLLHQFNQDSELSPRDVLILCPGVEDYAPYVLSVFRHPYAEWNADAPRLPCSVADRAPLDAEPLVAAYMDLLELPDSRFSVSKIISYLKLPAIAERFGIDESEVDTLSRWLAEACVHWGLDQQHNQKLLGSDSAQVDDRFSWRWGLRRLLMGFMRADHEHIRVDQQQREWLVLPTVEGTSSLLLGRLMQLLENLQYYEQRLNTPRSSEGWQTCLTEMKQQFFAEPQQSSEADEIITKVITDLRKQHDLANSQQKIPLTVIRHALQKRFSQADNYNQFLTGAVTFSSMVPMRSIPFKVVAILGLNDGQFPRQSQPNSFDVLELGSRAGDRSRRNDDRYLFLESLLSTRDKLYLSYVGRDIKNNNPKQPSLVLQELLDYLHKGYGWLAENNLQGQIDQQPLHPFSGDNFIAPQASFDQGWLKLAIAQQAGRNNLQVQSIQPLDWPDEALNISELVRALDNPLAYFANQRLNMWLKDQTVQLDDNEPFALDALTSYSVKDHLLQANLDQDDGNFIHQQQIAGRLPRAEFSQDKLADLQTKMQDFFELMSPSLVNTEMQSVTVELTVDEKQRVILSGEFYYRDDENLLVYWRPASRKGKDDVRLWLQHLLATIALDKPIRSQGWCEDRKNPVMIDAVLDKPAAEQHLYNILRVWRQASQQPLLLHAELGRALFEPVAEPQIATLQDCQENWLARFADQNTPLDRDGYLPWFYPQIPPLDETLFKSLKSVYAPLYQHLKKQTGRGKKS